VVTHGLSDDDYETSMRTLKELTMRFSMEGPIRPFLVEFPEETLERLGYWVLDDNYHVRRLVSEGTRPTLPWAPRIGLDIERPLPFLDELHADPTRYVTRSVANHLNDISKIDSKLVYKALISWKDEDRQRPDELNWITRHSLRTLVKKGDAQAMELLGFSPHPSIEVGSIYLDSSDGAVQAGETLRFSAEVTARRDEKLLVDYEIDFVKKDGSTRPKVFKLRQIKMEKGETTTLEKTHLLKKNASTFTLYPGTHKVSLKINGQVFPGTTFTLTE
jgi:3-methyladenine DNA glycosylase AlkC